MPQCASLIAEAISAAACPLLHRLSSSLVSTFVNWMRVDFMEFGARGKWCYLLHLYYFHAYILPISLSGLHVCMLCVKLYRVAWFATINALSTGMHIYVFMSSCQSLPGLYMHACAQLYRVALFATINVLRTGNKFESNDRMSESKYFLHLHHHVVFLK